MASDGKIYLSSEDGDIFVVKTGPKFELAGTNRIGQPLMATPAISEGVLFVRAQNDLFAISRFHYGTFLGCSGTVFHSTLDHRGAHFANLEEFAQEQPVWAYCSPARCAADLVRMWERAFEKDGTP